MGEDEGLLFRRSRKPSFAGKTFCGLGLTNEFLNTSNGNYRHKKNLKIRSQPISNYIIMTLKDKGHHWSQCAIPYKYEFHENNLKHVYIIKLFFYSSLPTKYT